MTAYKNWLIVTHFIGFHFILFFLLLLLKGPLKRIQWLTDFSFRLSSHFILQPILQKYGFLHSKNILFLQKQPSEFKQIFFSTIITLTSSIFLLYFYFYFQWTNLLIFVITNFSNTVPSSLLPVLFNPSSHQSILNWTLYSIYRLDCSHLYVAISHLVLI